MVLDWHIAWTMQGDVFLLSNFRQGLDEIRHRVVGIVAESPHGQCYSKAAGRQPEESATHVGPKVDVSSIVKDVIAQIKANGDTAVRRYSQKFDSWSSANFKLSAKQVDDIIASVDPQVIRDIKEVQRMFVSFAEKQKSSLHEFEIGIQPGVLLGQKNNPIKRVGWWLNSSLSLYLALHGIMYI
ncbi:hypothetical protein RBB50_010284 [Rhinocladiella similis]